MHLANFDIAGFLRDYWQRRPLLIRNPWDRWRNPLEGDELAGLACEKGVESRLVVRQGGEWQVENGPIPAARFGELGADPWTLLVQAVDHHVPQVAALIEPFRFIPDWRIDDVMVSYADHGGGVGPHFDQYDVFLIQGQGTRRWRIGRACNEATPLLDHPELRLLARFEPSVEWLLEPGDILYLPPGTAHDGSAEGDNCMTYSVGFRAPSRGELIGNWADDLLAEMREDDRYADPGLAAQDNPGEIRAEALERLHAMITERMADRGAFARWFGRYSSTPKYPDMDWQPEQALDAAAVRALIGQGAALLRNPASRFAFIRENTGDVLLFVDGESYPCAGNLAPLAEALCARPDPMLDPALGQSAEAARLLAELVNRGALAFAVQD